MALGAVRQRMPPRQREEVVRNKSAFPAGRLMAPLTIGHPIIGKVIRVGDPSQVGLMADFALGRRTAELPGSGTLVAALAVADGMNAHQREAGACMLGNQSDGFPTNLTMTTLALQSERRRMGIDMTS